LTEIYIVKDKINHEARAGSAIALPFYLDTSSPVVSGLIYLFFNKMGKESERIAKLFLKQWSCFWQ